MLVYLLGPIGIIIALLASNTSPYAGYHVRQALKFTVVEILSTIALVLLDNVRRCSIRRLYVVPYCT